MVFQYFFPLGINDESKLNKNRTEHDIPIGYLVCGSWLTKVTFQQYFQLFLHKFGLVMHFKTQGSCQKGFNSPIGTVFDQISTTNWCFRQSIFEAKHACITMTCLRYNHPFFILVFSDFTLCFYHDMKFQQVTQLKWVVIHKTEIALVESSQHQWN